MQKGSNVSYNKQNTNIGLDRLYIMLKEDSETTVIVFKCLILSDLVCYSDKGLDCLSLTLTEDFNYAEGG